MPLDLSAIEAPYTLEAFEGGAPPASEQAQALSDRRRGLHPLLVSGPIVSAVGDAYTTSRYMNTHREIDARPDRDVVGPPESNPLLSGIADDPLALYGVKLGTGIGISFLSDLLARKGHRNLGKALSIAGTVVPAGLAVNNILQERRIRRQAGPGGL